MKLGKINTIVTILFFSLNNMLLADDKIVSTPLINLENLKPSFEEVDKNTENKDLQNLELKQKKNKQKKFKTDALKTYYISYMQELEDIRSSVKDINLNQIRIVYNQNLHGNDKSVDLSKMLINSDSIINNLTKT